MIKENMRKLGLGLATLGAMALPFASHAAADPTVVNTAGDVATSVKENAVGIVTQADVLVALVALPALFFAIRWIVGKIFGRRK